MTLPSRVMGFEIMQHRGTAFRRVSNHESVWLKGLLKLIRRSLVSWQATDR